MVTWEKIRSLKGSQHNAFEELVCQLARVETKKLGKFTRIAAPDGGVEAICELDDGSLYGWQAKYFLYSFESSQWKQIEESFKNSLRNYPELVKFFVCVPVDRNNPVVNGKKSFLQKWEEHAKKWINIAKREFSRNIEIEFWGSSELLERLSKPENAGKQYYWFGDTELSEPWFKQYATQAINNLGARYTPEINIEVPVAIYFEALSRSEYFKTNYSKTFHELLVDIQNDSYKIKKHEKLYISFSKVLSQLKAHLNLSNYSLDKNIPRNDLIHQVESLILQINQHMDYKSADKEQKELNIEFNQIKSKFFKLKELLDSNEIKLFNGDVLWLSGQAGSGKSHLLGDITSQKLKQERHSILLLGQDFTEKSNVWSQILGNQLNLNIQPAEFLSALDSIAESQNERFILAIDALNEGEGKDLWNNQLNGFISLVRNYPNIGLVLSVRNTYNFLIQQSLTNKDQICEIWHSGFSNIEFEAIQTFFKYYQLTLPNIPLLNPEFSNPLYLKLLCEGLVKQGLKSMPKGGQGLNQVISSYIQGIEKAVSKQIDEDESLNLVQRAINVVARLALSSENLEYITVRRAIANELQHDISDANAKKFIDYLIKEGILAKNIYSSNKNEIIYFIYERVGDYQKANLILENITSVDDLKYWIQSEKMTDILNKPYYYRGLLESLAVLIPEKFNCELFSLIIFSEQYKQFLLCEIIAQSLIWRNKKSINKEEIINYLGNYWGENGYCQWIDILYQISFEPDHPLNIRHLHNKLLPLSLADRDAQWTTFISADSDECPSIERLLLWCQKYSQVIDVEPESLLLSGIAVSWILGSTNIKQRNEAMKSLSYLFVNRLDIAHKLYLEFAMVNDPYILDGILYSIYHSALYSSNLEGLKELSDAVFNNIFNVSEDKEVYPNVLVRDSACKLIEFSLARSNNYTKNEIMDIIVKITPPYHSSFPDKLPSTESIDQKYTSNEQKVILRSMTTEYGRGVCMYGDFGRYTFQSTLRRWEISFDKKDEIIDINLLSNYACELIFEKFGYDAKKHGEFDSGRSNWHRGYYKNEGKIERVGKKYQWLALFEVLARVMDNFKAPKENYQKNSPLVWITNLNDFFLPRANIEIVSPLQGLDWNTYTNQIPVINADEYCSGDIQEWIQDTQLLPNINNMIEVEINGESWVVLQRFDNLENSPEFGEVHSQTKNLWFQVRSYLVHNKELANAKSWLKKQNFMGNWMPKGREYYNSNLQEFFDVSSHKDRYTPNWEMVDRGYDYHTIPDDQFEVLATVESHTWERSYGNESETIYAPCYFLFNGVGMNISLKKGFWIDSENELVCFNPVVQNEYSDMILIKKDALLCFLKRNNLSIIWTVLGEKLAWECHHDIYEKRLDIYGLYYLNKTHSITGKLNTVIS